MTKILKIAAFTLAAIAFGCFLRAAHAQNFSPLATTEGIEKGLLASIAEAATDPATGEIDPKKAREPIEQTCRNADRVQSAAARAVLRKYCP